MKKHLIIPALICAALFLSCVRGPVLSADAADVTGSITVIFEHEGEPVEGAEFRIYRAGERRGTSYRLTPPFSAYPVKAPGTPGSEAWRNLAETLAAYAARDQIASLASGKTDAEGELVFSGLSDGLYLIVGSMLKDGDLWLFPQPLLVTVPYVLEDGREDREVVVEPKYDFRSVDEKEITLNALKVWKDSGNESKRPADVTVQLLRDGKIYDEQTLNAANNWRHTWEHLDSAHVWQMTEKSVPDDYTVAVTQDGMTFTATNTNDNPPPPPPFLPQTGMTWWPVFTLAGVGVTLVATGLMLTVRKKR